MNKQKAKRRLPVPWPTFDGGHKRKPADQRPLDEAQLAILREVYEPLVVPLALGTDSVISNGELCDSISKEFAKLPGSSCPAYHLSL